ASSRGMPRARHCLLFVALFLDLSLYAGGQEGYVSLSAFERILQGDTGQPEDPLLCNGQRPLRVGQVRTNATSRPRVCMGCSAPKADSCKYDVSSCLSLETGGTCQIKCRGPFYAGTPTIGRCPLDNSPWGNNGVFTARRLERELQAAPASGPAAPEDLETITMATTTTTTTAEAGGLVWDWPDCTLTCGASLTGSEVGYIKLADGSWGCADGYIGEASYACIVGEDCEARSSLVGCVALQACVPPSS
ncbi:unnamed protein product, partial [Polarella glacialis]